jgi:hydrogenase maturation protease
MSQPTTLIVGLGSDFGDDRVGFIIAERLRGLTRATDVRSARSPGDLLSWMQDYGALHVIDACRGSAAPGTIARFAWPSAAIEQLAFMGTHDLSLPPALRLADKCRLLPKTVVIWAIETQQAETVPESFLSPLSPPVAAAAESLIDRLLAELGSREAQHA